MNKDYLQEALMTFNNGDWYGWKKIDSDGNKIPNDQRMTYANIKVIKDGATIPSEADVNAKIQEIKDAETTKANAKISGNTKLLALGLSQAEATALTGYTPPVAE